jgi:hypothetical protein
MLDRLALVIGHVARAAKYIEQPHALGGQHAPVPSKCVAMK